MVEDILLTTINEAITNSLKHGNLTTIDISLEIINDDLHMIIKDNGEGCKSINKSNGLNGITARIKRINGNVSFTSPMNKGFTIKVLIPGGSLND
jgi:signal transduction histidine kinase